MAVWKPTRYKTKPEILRFGDGVNTFGTPFQIQDNELTDARNMSDEEYPAIRTRPARSTSITPLYTPNAIGQRSNQYIHVVDGNTWQYWSPSSTEYVRLTTGLSSTRAAIEDFATGETRYTILMNSTQKKIWDGASTALDLGDVNTPFTKLFTVHKGRVYAARDNDVMYCALNDPNDWTTANDSGRFDITRSKGSITGIYEYNDHVVVFTEFGMHELFGSGPEDYELIDVEGETGCISDNSIVKANRRLYWANYDGVYEYDGASPRKISDKVNDYWNKINFTYKTDIVAGSKGDYLYYSVPYDSTSNNLLLVYNTRLKTWHPEEAEIKDFVTIGNILYGVTYSGSIYEMRNTTGSRSDIDYYAITKPFTNNAIEERKTVSDMHIVASGETGATLNVAYSTSMTSTSFTDLLNIDDLSSEASNQKINIPLSALQKVPWYRLKLYGRGDVTVHALGKNVRIGRDTNG